MQWYAIKGIKMALWEILLCCICQFLLCNYLHYCWFQTTNMMSLNVESERDVHIQLKANASQLQHTTNKRVSTQEHIMMLYLHVLNNIVYKIYKQWLGISKMGNKSTIIIVQYVLHKIFHNKRWWTSRKKIKDKEYLTVQVTNLT